MVRYPRNSHIHYLSLLLAWSVNPYTYRTTQNRHCLWYGHVKERLIDACAFRLPPQQVISDLPTQTVSQPIYHSEIREPVRCLKIPSKPQEWMDLHSKVLKNCQRNLLDEWKLVCKETVVPRQWGSETLKFVTKQVDIRVKIPPWSNFNEADVSRVNSSSE